MTRARAASLLVVAVTALTLIAILHAPSSSATSSSGGVSGVMPAVAPASSGCSYFTKNGSPGQQIYSLSINILNPSTLYSYALLQGTSAVSNVSISDLRGSTFHLIWDVNDTTDVFPALAWWANVSATTDTLHFTNKVGDFAVVCYADFFGVTHPDTNSNWCENPQPATSFTPRPPAGCTAAMRGFTNPYHYQVNISAVNGQEILSWWWSSESSNPTVEPWLTNAVPNGIENFSSTSNGMGVAMGLEMASATQNYTPGGSWCGSLCGSKGNFQYAGAVAFTPTPGSPPPAPTGLAANPVSAFAINWTWTQSTGGGILNNTLHVWTGASCSGTSVGVFSTGTPRMFYLESNLTASTAYSGEVSSWNSTGQSLQSSCATGTTLSLPPPPPQTASLAALIGVGIVLLIVFALASIAVRKRGDG